MNPIRQEHVTRDGLAMAAFKTPVRHVCLVPTGRAINGKPIGLKVSGKYMPVNMRKGNPHAIYCANTGWWIVEHDLWYPAREP